MERQATAKNYRQVLCWLRGRNTTPNPEMEEMFLDVITSMIQERIRSEEPHRIEDVKRRAEIRRDYKSPLSLRSFMDSMKESGETELTYEELFGKRSGQMHESRHEAKPDIPDELDSVVVGKVLRHMGSLEKVLLNMSQIQLIMYISYGVWLASTGCRLISEHPQVWQFGPVFPRAYNKMRKDLSDGEAEYESLRNSRPEIIEFLEIQFRRFAWTKASVLSVPHTATGTPWAKTKKRHQDKWGTPMDDADINEWFNLRMSNK